MHAYDGEVVQVTGRLTGAVAVRDVRAACALVPRERWDAVALEVLEGLARSSEARPDLDRYEVAAPLLRSRVMGEGAVLLDDVVAVPLCDGLVEVLVADVLGAVTALAPTVVLGWDRPVDALFALARDQVLADGLLTRTELDLDAGALVSLESTSAFAATHVRWLASYLDVPSAGALVALPTRHLLLAAPMLRRADVLDAAQLLLVNAERLEREGPGGLSPDLFWWRPDAMVRLPGTPTSLSPPPEFLEVLDRLP